jgi:hypothetical protein
MFNFFKRRKEQKEIERKMQVRQGKRHIERYVQRQKQKINQYLTMAKRAYRRKDSKMFQQISAFILVTQREVLQWERRLLYFDMIEARQDQVKSAAEFAQAYKSMAESMLAVSDPANMAQIQRDIEMGLARAEMMDDMLESLVDMSEGMLSEMVSFDQDPELRQIMQSLGAEAEQEEQGALDTDIEASLRAIEEQLGKA